MYKLSKYIIISDSIGKKNQYIIYSTRSTTFVIISKETVDLLLAENFSNVEQSTFRELENCQIIIKKEENELKIILDKYKNAINDNDTLYFVIQPTAQCQLGCHYCGQKHSKNYLTQSDYPLILNRIEEKLEMNSKYKNIQIGWFGAEPLLGLKSMEILTNQIKELASKYQCSYTSKITTNGLSLKPDVYNRLIDLAIKKIEITLDGTAATHDQRRYTKKGNATFDIIFDNILSCIHSPRFNPLSTQLVIRCNVDKNNHQDVYNLIDLLDQHQLQDKIDEFYLAPIHSWGNDAHLQALEKKEFAEFEIDCLITLYKKGFNVHLIPQNPKSRVCMALTNDNEVIDSFGNIYNCTEIPYVESYQESSFLIENLHTDRDGKPNSRSMMNWYEDIEQKDFPCSSCSILPICGGACPKQWYEGNCPCPSTKFNLKERILLYVHQQVNQKK